MDGIFLLLGTNQGNRKQNLQSALALIKSKVNDIHNISCIYETAPWGYHNQPDFYNLTIEISYSGTPKTLLRELLAIEKELGRKRRERWSDRIIDIDIIYFGKLIMKDPVLTVPHPEIQSRRFTLVPLNEIAPEFLHPLLGKSNRELLRICPDPLTVQKKDKIPKP